MPTDDQTALLPRQKAAPPEETSPPTDAWQQSAENLPPAEGLTGQRQALKALAWLLPTLLVAALSVVRATWPSQRAAELDYWGFTLRPWDEALRLLGDLDTTSVPYHLALKGWAEIFGSSDFALRLPSILAMATATALLAKVGADLVSPRVGFIAGMFFALLPTTSRYAQEIGPQALTICFAALATHCLVRYFDQGGFSRMAGYGLTVALLGLTSAPALSLLVGHGVAVLLMRRRVFLPWLVGAVVGLLPLGTLFFLLRPPRIALSWTSPVDLPDVVHLPNDLFGVALLGGVLIGLGLLGFSLRKPGAVFTTWAVLPILTLYVASQVTPVWRSEALLLTLPAWALLAAMALTRAPVVRGVFAALVVALLAFPTHLDVRRRDGHGQAGSALAAVLIEQVKPDDVIVFGPGPDDGRTGRDLLARYVPADRRPKDVLATRAPRTDGHLLAEECVDVATCLGPAPRVWLLRASATAVVLDGMPAAKDGELRTRYVVERTWNLTGLTLTLFTPAPTAGNAGPAR